MRRRQIFAAKAAPAESVPEIEPAMPETPKGHCPICGEYIGRGVAFHAKKCKPQS